MGRAIELSLLAIFVIIAAFYVIPKVMYELQQMRTPKEDAKKVVNLADRRKDEDVS